MFRLRRARHLTQSHLTIRVIDTSLIGYSSSGSRRHFLRVPPLPVLPAMLVQRGPILSGDSRPGPDGLCSMRLYQGHSNLNTIANYTAPRLRLLDSRLLLVLSRPPNFVEGILGSRRLEAGNLRDSSFICPSAVWGITDRKREEPGRGGRGGSWEGISGSEGVSSVSFFFLSFLSYHVSPHFLFSPHLSLRLLFLWSVFNLGKARWGQGELPWAAGGPIGVAADGKQERTT